MNRTRLTRCCALFVYATAYAERLPIQTLTSADGLAGDRIDAILADSRGFVWFGTSEGLSRFDGHEFVNYTHDQGLPYRGVSALLETRRGDLWIGSRDRVCRFNPRGEERFSCSPPEDDAKVGGVGALHEDRAGRILAGADGLFSVAERNGIPVLTRADPVLRVGKREPYVHAFEEDGNGDLWIAGTFGLFRRHPDGTTDDFALPAKLLETGGVVDLTADPRGRLWAATHVGLCEVDTTADAGAIQCLRLYTRRDGLPEDYLYGVRATEDGAIWVVSGAGLGRGRWDEKDSPSTFISYGRSSGLVDIQLITLGSDHEGNLWVGSESGGAMRVALHGMTSFTEADGLAGARVSSIFEDLKGELVVTGGSAADRVIQRFDGRGFTAVLPRVPPSIRYMGWSWGQTSFEDREGAWWITTGQGLLRWSGVHRVEDLARVLPTTIFTKRDGLPGEDIFRLYEDRHGDVWVGNVIPPVNGLTRWERSTGRLHVYGPELGIAKEFCATAFAEDRGNDLWIGSWDAGLVRLREGRFTLYGPEAGAPKGFIHALHVDKSDRLWIASENGLSCVDDPEAAQPRFREVMSDQSPPIRSARSLAEDGDGNLFVGTPVGVYELDASGRFVRRYTTEDGLPSLVQSTAYRDRHGTLWFGTLHGLGRLEPATEPPHVPADPLIRGVRVAGVPQLVPETGEPEVADLTFGSEGTSLEIDFVSPGSPMGGDTRYQFRVEGQDRDFRPASDQRTVLFPSIAPGRYRFVVRALGAHGLTSARTASVSFTVLRPVWQRPWFVAAVTLLVAALGTFAYRARVARVIELERVRASIATDLHDDIGSSLSRIAIVSEVARQRAGRGEGDATRPLATIAAAARELVDTMGDIVWAVDPKQDSYADLVQRMRDFAEELCASAAIELRFSAADDRATTSLDARLRRAAFLVFKESVNNAVKHSKCAVIETRVRIAGVRLFVAVVDDGKGIDDVRRPDGHGLANLKRRAAELGGTCEIASEAGQGTKVEFSAPLRPAARRRTYRNA